MKVKYEFIAKGPIFVTGSGEMTVDAEKWQRATLAERQELMNEASRCSIMNSAMEQLQGKVHVIYSGKEE